MGCCLAIAYLFAQARRAWFAVMPGEPAMALAFAPPARRSAPGAATFTVERPPPRATSRTAPASTATKHSVGKALVVAGLVWFGIGVIGMHAFGWFGWAEASLLTDTAFHSSGLWMAAAGAALLAVRS